MKTRWMEAGDAFQVPFMLAAQDVLQQKSITCPKCHIGILRYYFHVMNHKTRHGTLWVWCPHCFTKCHLPRVTPHHMAQVDPFANLDLDQFAELEMDAEEPLINRVNRYWEEGKLK